MAILTVSLCWDLSESGPVSRATVFLISSKVALAGMFIVLEILMSLVGKLKGILHDILGLIWAVSDTTGKVNETLRMKVEMDEAERQKALASAKLRELAGPIQPGATDGKG